MQPTGSVIAGTNSDLKQSVNVTYSDNTTSPFDMPIPSFKSSDAGNALTINGTQKTFKLSVSDVDTDKYSYTLSITGDSTSIFAPTTGGTQGYILVSNGSEAPSWNSLEQLHATADNYGTVKVTNGNGLNITNGIIDMARGSTSTLGTVRVTNGNGLSINGEGVISKAADSLSFTSGTNGFSYSYKLNGATTVSTETVSISIDDGVIE